MAHPSGNISRRLMSDMQRRQNGISPGTVRSDNPSKHWSLWMSQTHPRIVMTYSSLSLQRIDAYFWKEVLWVVTESNETRGTRTSLPPHSCPEGPHLCESSSCPTALATRLLCCVAFYLLGVAESPEIENLHFWIFPIMIPFMFLNLSQNPVPFHRAHRCQSHPDTQALCDRDGTSSNSVMWANL